jgi:hypothetical protein
MGYDEAGRITKIKIFLFDGCEWYTFEDGSDCPVRKADVEDSDGSDDDAKEFSTYSGKEDWPSASVLTERTTDVESIPKIANEIFCVDDFKPFYAEAIQIVVEEWSGNVLFGKFGVLVDDPEGEICDCGAQK